MKKQVPFILKSKVLTAFVFFVALFLFNAASFAQTTIFTDDFNRTTLSPGGSPNVTYTSSTKYYSTSTSATDVIAIDAEYKLKLSNYISPATTSSSSKAFVMATMPTGTYNSTLNANTGLVTWTFNMRHNRNQTTMTGWDPLTQYGIGTILACNYADPTNTSANGYAVVMGGDGTINSNKTYDLVYFTGGLTANSNITTIIKGVSFPGTDLRLVLGAKVTYNPSTNEWVMFQELNANSTSYIDPANIAVTAITGGPFINSTYVGTSMPNYGWIGSHPISTTSLAFSFDNYKVAVGGSNTIINFYLQASADCTDKTKWGTNTNGTGTNPTDFSSANQYFNIVNPDAAIGSDWTVSGSGSKIVLGNGTVANQLTIPSNASLTGKIDVGANCTLTISHPSVFPTLTSMDISSTIVFNGLTAQSVQAGTYGNLSISSGATAAKATGAITINGILTIAAGSIFDMDIYKLSDPLFSLVLSGSGTLKTSYVNFAAAIPSNKIWPYDLFFNSVAVAPAFQKLVAGTYKNLDISGGLRTLDGSVDFSVSGAFVTGTSTLTGTTNIITFNGTSLQTLPDNIAASRLVISNTAGVSLTAAAEKIPNTCKITFEKGNLKTAGFTETLGDLTLIDDSSITLTSGSKLIFSDSNLIAWTSGKTLTINGWTGTPGQSGTSGQIFIGSNASSLTPAQLAQIKFGSNGAILLSTGELVSSGTLANTDFNRSDLRVYPNPMTNQFTISSATEISAITITNLLGQSLKSFQISPATSVSVDVSDLAKGTYLVKVASAGNSQIVRVIKD